MCRIHETTTEQLRVSTTPRYVKPQSLDQLEEWMKENPIPYISNVQSGRYLSLFSDYWSGRQSGHVHVNQTYPDVVRMWRQFHGCPVSGVGIEWVFFSDGKQHDDLNFFESQEKDHGQDPGKHIEVINQYDVADLWWQRSLHRWWWHIQETQVVYSVRRLLGGRGRRRWLWCLWVNVL